jgi:integration host factor subunit beta
MTKSELIQLIDRKQTQISTQDLELAVNLILETLSYALVDNQRIEIRGFGAFTVRHRNPRIARNPKTGASVALPSRRAVHFKPGKELKENLLTSTVPLASNAT